ncbi:MAG: ribbon-helix-helix protein, CopG family [Chloroflexaceae bacterium]|jgi:predicted transcriptional regulator|nr:ribbon-helix-helix protein, CopG family [Chloroflexaceae bacterium]
MSVQVNIRVPDELVARLDTIAEHTGRKRPDLVHAAIRAFVESEMEFIEAVERGRAQARAGETVSLEQVDNELRAIIDAARTSRKSA